LTFFCTEGGDPYLGVRFGYDLGTVFSVLGYGLGTAISVLGPYLGMAWAVLGCGLGLTRIWFWCGLFRSWGVLFLAYFRARRLSSRATRIQAQRKTEQRAGAN
jgi:hypothetical protein